MCPHTHTHTSHLAMDKADQQRLNQLMKREERRTHKERALNLERVELEHLKRMQDAIEWERRRKEAAKNAFGPSWELTGIVWLALTVLFYAWRQQRGTINPFVCPFMAFDLTRCVYWMDDIEFVVWGTYVSYSVIFLGWSVYESCLVWC